MRLIRMNLRRKEKYEDPNQGLTGEITFLNNLTKVEVKMMISDAAAARIVELCAEGIVDAGHELAQLVLDDLKGS
jgi:hypothetical protein